MKRLAIIPAREGSKGLPRKNLATVNGETLVARAVRLAKETGIFGRIIISTDIEARFDAEVIRRPSELATDTSDVTDAIRHVLSVVHEEFDTLTLLQPTSPLRTADQVVSCVKIAEEGLLSCNACLTVSEVPRHYHAVMQLTRDKSGIGR